jgi:hypothetical protein
VNGNAGRFDLASVAQELDAVTRRATKAHLELLKLTRALDEEVAETHRLLAEADALLGASATRRSTGSGSRPGVSECD